jgi:CDP-glucose 4,6-dehydratase
MKQHLQKTFSGRTVFLTGHTGFKGSWLALWLHSLGAKVHGYALKPPTEPSNFVASDIRKFLASHTEADIRDAASLSAALKSAQPDFVFHLAAQPLVRESYNCPRETFDVNVMGTVSVLDAVRALQRPCVTLVVTSDKCYENREQIWGYRENDAMGGFDPYSASKGATEIVTASYRQSFFSPEKLATHGVKLASARAGNVIGGGDWAKDRIVVDAAISASKGLPIRVRSPKAVRPWQHVLEPLSGYLTLAAQMDASNDPSLCSGWNFGPRSGDEATVGELVDVFCKNWAGTSWVDASDPYQPHEAQFLRLSVDKAMSRLDWHPRWNLQQTVQRTAQWYQKFYAQGKNMLTVCEDNIRAYESATLEHKK